jgi:hypothetical protein
LRAQLEAVQSHIQQWPSAQSIKASAVKQALAAMPAPQVVTEVIQMPVQLFAGNDELEVKLRAEMAMQTQHMATQVLAEADARAQSSADELASAIASQLVELHATQTAQHQLVDRSLAEMQQLMNTATQQQQSDFAPISHSLAHLQTRIALVEAAAENGAQQAHAVQVCFHVKSSFLVWFGNCLHLLYDRCQRSCLAFSTRSSCRLRSLN